MVKINNNNIRAAKRGYFNRLSSLWRGTNGVSSSDFNSLLETFIDDDLEIHNRTHEKSEKDANDKESDSIGESP